ncbi:MAG: acireductone dioxygenase [Myxococcota bacterium]
MSRLRVYRDDQPDASTTIDNHDAIADALKQIGIRFERWSAQAELAADASQEDVIAAYRSDVDRLMKESGFQSVDVISLSPNHPQKTEFRKKFLEEHTHAEFEIRFFVDGAGQFNLHKDGKVYEVLCERGDLIAVPDGTRHWFDMGPEPNFKCIRFFTNPEGWVAQFTGDDIAGKFPRFE